MAGLGLAIGLGRLVPGTRIQIEVPPGADTIETYLSAVTSREVRVSLRIGGVRANRKPILELLTAAGDSVGFAKIGTSPLTRDLVQAEHDTLLRLSRAGLRQVTVPEVLHYGQWNGLNVLVLSTLPTWQDRGSPDSAQLLAGVEEVARVGLLRREALSDSAYFQGLRDRLACVGDSCERAALLEALAMVADRQAGTVLTYGAWHGDFTPWNTASTASRLLVWDWERFASAVPLGFDALHYWLQGQVRRRSRDPQAAAADCADSASQLLQPLGIGKAEARLTAILYLADLAIRYLADQQARIGAQHGAAGRWLIPVIAHRVKTL
jgi:hypothetical protein